MIRHLAGLLIVSGLILLVFAAATGLRACEMIVASHYGTESGNRTANGERFDGSSLTAAHKTLPFGTRLRVTYRGKSVVVRINDRGPYIKGRSLDLSTAAARKLGMVRAGVARVCAERIH